MDQGSAERREAERLAVLTDMRLLDTPASESFDRITRMATRLFDVPISAVSLTDRGRQWFKSHVGTPGREIPREQAPCAEVTRTADFLAEQRSIRSAPGLEAFQKAINTDYLRKAVG